jgi:hypothetical protein
MKILVFSFKGILIAIPSLLLSKLIQQGELFCDKTPSFKIFAYRKKSDMIKLQ